MQKFRLIKFNLRNALTSKFKPETLKKLRQVELDYLRLFKGVMKISLLSLFLFLVHRQLPYFNTYEIEYVKNEINNFILDKIGPIDYKPPIHLPSCLAQMIYNEVKESPAINYRREYIKTHDGAVISLDWAEDKEDNKKYDKILVILHGLTGGSESSYIREIVEEYSKLEGFKIVVVNYRGINGTPLMTQAIYHAGYTEDIHTAMCYIKENYPNLKCYTLGTSMGANIFTKLFANTDEFNEYVKGFISISNPLNCYEVEKRNRGSILDFFLIQRQLKYVEKHHEVLREIIGIVYFYFLDIEKLSMINNYREFDQLVTLKLFEFDSVDDYYIKSSSVRDIENLKIYSLFLNAHNDKLSPVDTIELDKTFRSNPKLILILTRWGGHVCWFHGLRKPKRWFIQKTINYVTALEELNSLNLKKEFERCAF